MINRILIATKNDWYCALLMLDLLGTKQPRFLTIYVNPKQICSQSLSIG
jgi:hypothetical protein